MNDGAPTATTDRSQGALSREAIKQVDSSDQLDDTLSLPDHLHDALWRVESAALPERETAGGMVVAGMGGSGIGGALARAALGDQASRPMFVTRVYGLPTWTTPETTVLCCSYSGNTEETLACYESAGLLGAQRVVATTGGRLAEMAREDGVPVIPLPGGFQPRAAVAYMTVSALEVAARCGVGPAHEHGDRRRRLPYGAPRRRVGARTLRKARSRRKSRAGILGSIPVVTGAGLTASIAYRWKTQINENAKQPAFSNELPELDHNELVGWEGAPAVGRLSAIFLDDSDAHPRLKARLELTASLIAPTAAASFRVQTRGETGIERVISLVLLGDLVSLYLAVLRGVDPGPVHLIERFKSELAKQ